MQCNNVTAVWDFYGEDFNSNRLTLYRDMLLDIRRSRNIAIDNLEDAVSFLKSNVTKSIYLAHINVDLF